MEPREFLKLAEHLVVAQNAGASHFRTAIGRAYYATFHLSIQVLGELGLPPSEASTAHQEVIRLLQQSGDDDLAGTGGLLDDLRTDRLKADYKLRDQTADKRPTAQLAVETAQSVFKDLDSFMESSVRRSGMA
jgi:uncharacterized protein (UPF0332 family)